VILRFTDKIETFFYLEMAVFGYSDRLGIQSSNHASNKETIGIRYILKPNFIYS